MDNTELKDKIMPVEKGKVYKAKIKPGFGQRSSYSADVLVEHIGDRHYQIVENGRRRTIIKEDIKIYDNKPIISNIFFYLVLAIITIIIHLLI